MRGRSISSKSHNETISFKKTQQIPTPQTHQSTFATLFSACITEITHVEVVEELFKMEILHSLRLKRRENKRKKRKKEIKKRKKERKKERERRRETERERERERRRERERGTLRMAADLHACMRVHAQVCVIFMVLHGEVFHMPRHIGFEIWWYYGIG
jgi:hypothetical protein